MLRANSRELADSAVSSRPVIGMRERQKNIAETRKMSLRAAASRFAQGSWAATHCRGNEPMAVYEIKSRLTAWSKFKEMASVRAKHRGRRTGHRMRLRHPSSNNHISFRGAVHFRTLLRFFFTMPR
jgi:hypothetical protein